MTKNSDSPAQANGNGAANPEASRHVVGAAPACA